MSRSLHLLQRTPVACGSRRSWRPPFRLPIVAIAALLVLSGLLSSACGGTESPDAVSAVAPTASTAVGETQASDPEPESAATTPESEQGETNGAASEPDADGARAGASSADGDSGGSGESGQGEQSSSSEPEVAAPDPAAGETFWRTCWPDGLPYAEDLEDPSDERWDALCAMKLAVPEESIQIQAVAGGISQLAGEYEMGLITKAEMVEQLTLLEPRTDATGIAFFETG
jgi:hypothetical protein